VYGIIHGAESGWTTAGSLLGLGVALLSLGAFVLWELRTARPMLDVRLFAVRGFSAGTLALTVQFLCMFGFFLVGLQFLQLVLGYTALHSALCLLPMGMIVMPLSRKVPHIVDRFGPRAVVTTGLTLLGLGLVVMAQLDGGSSYWHFFGGLLCFGFGVALTSTPSTTAIVSSLPKAKQGVASAMNDVSREVGSALGIAILGSLFNSGYRAAISEHTAGLPAEAAHAVGESAGAGFAVADQLGAAGDGLADAVTDAFAAGLGDALTAGAVIALVTAAVCARWMPRRSAVAEVHDLDDATSLVEAA
jgi:hypothetical protein